MPKENTKARILEIASELLASGGIGAVSFDAIAGRLGRTKQAVLYWYPNKQELLAAMFLPALTEEADVAEQAVQNAETEAAATRAFAEAVLAFHLGDLDRYRMMYLLPQTLRSGGVEAPPDGILRDVHPVTDRMYSALASKLSGDRVRARQKAFAVHSAVLGLVLMFGLADRLGDPLKHSAEDAMNALLTSFGS